MKRLPALLLLVAVVFARHGDAADGKADRDAHRLGERINEYRVQHGLHPLVLTAPLSELAHDHAADMARAGRLSHDGFRQRFAKARSPRCVENVGSISGTPETAFDAWRDSPTHERNLVDARITRMGIAIDGRYVAFFACQ